MKTIKPENGIELIPFVLKSHMPGRGGWGNGYLAIPSAHPCYGKDYNDIHSRCPSVNVHGGLTFAGKSIPGQPSETTGLWIIGFDTLHYNDSPAKWPNERSVLEEVERLRVQLMRIYKRSIRPHKTAEAL